MTGRVVAARLPRQIRDAWSPERTALAVLAASVLLAHDVGRMLRQSFWTDEGWVAVTTRFPLSDLAQTTSSTPIGWSFMLRLIPFGGPERIRLVPLAFAAAAVVAAYVAVRGLGWATRWAAAGAGLVAAFAVLLVPAMLVRNDLKQFTADAAFALVILALTSRVERDWSRRNLGLLGCGVVGGMLFSHTTAFVGAAALVALILVQAARRSWQRCAEVLVGAAITAAGMLIVHAAFDRRAVVSGLTNYWANFYLPTDRGLWGATRYLHRIWAETHRYFGLGPIWLGVPLVVAGLVTIAQLGRPATSLAVVVLSAEMPALSALRQYPFLDVRTGTFFFVVMAVVAAVGVVGLASWVGRRTRPWISPVLVLLVAIAFALPAVPDTSIGPKPAENVHEQTAYVDAHRVAGDVVVVSSVSAAGFAYYWHHGDPGIKKTTANLQRYLAVFPGQPDIVTVAARTPEAISDALTAATLWMTSHPGAHVWLIRTHVGEIEAQMWRSEFAAHGLRAQRTGPRDLAQIVRITF